MTETIITATILNSLDELAKRNNIGFRNRKTYFADVCGLKYSAVAQWYGTGGKTKNIRTENLNKLAKHFKVSLDAIVTGNLDEELEANSNLDIQLKRLKNSGLQDQGASLLENFLDTVLSTK